MGVHMHDDGSGLWLMAKNGSFAVGPTKYTRPRRNEIVVKNYAVAINPTDWITPLIGGFIYPWLKYPFILGTDVAGEVVEVGGDVTRFKIGDRVFGNAVGVDKDRNNPAEGGFQTYTVLFAHMASPIPDSMPFENAVVLPLGASTAACGLFQKDHLGLSFPIEGAHPKGKTVIVWGGSSSVGSNAIQLAVAAGYEVITTASAKNFDYVRKLGASEVFNHGSRSVVSDIVSALQGREHVGAIAIGPGSTKGCLAIVSRTFGTKFVSIASPPVSFDDAPEQGGRMLWLFLKMARLIASNVSMMITARVRGVRMKFIFGTTLINNDVGPMLYEAFLPSALADGRYIAAPSPMVVGEGLGAIPNALMLQRRGVSAAKVVVKL